MPIRAARQRTVRPGQATSKRGQSFAQGRAEFDVVIGKVVRLELRLLVFQIRVVRIVTAVLKCALRVPDFAEFAKENTLAEGTLQPGEKPQRIEGALFFPAHQQSGIGQPRELFRIERLDAVLL